MTFLRVPWVENFEGWLTLGDFFQSWCYGAVALWFLTSAPNLFLISFWRCFALSLDLHFIPSLVRRYRDSLPIQVDGLNCPYHPADILGALWLHDWIGILANTFDILGGSVLSLPVSKLLAPNHPDLILRFPTCTVWASRSGCHQNLWL